jgi:hypothetical protein
MSRGDEVKDLAYRLWEEAGRPEGRHEEFWLAAEAQITVNPTPAKPRAKAKAESDSESAPKPKRAACKPRTTKPKAV